MLTFYLKYFFLLLLDCWILSNAKKTTTLNGCYYESPIDLIPKYHHRSTTTFDLSDMFKTFRHSLYFATQGRETERKQTDQQCCPKYSFYY